jgi:YVTN family beta-propeller protein
MLMLSVQLPTGAVALTTFPAGVGPWAVAVNPVTNKVYVANYNFYPGEVTVIDRGTSTAVNVAAGYSPAAVAVNPVTNKIYVANFNGNSVTVIDGATNATKTVVDSTGTGPAAVAVNPETNRIYIGNYKSRNVTVIDGDTDSIITTVSLQNTAAVGVVPLMSLAVNPVTNRVYVCNYHDNSVTMIDGATNVPVNLAVGINPRAVAVNPATNKIYVVNYSSGSMSVIDGASNTVAPAFAVGGSSPIAVAVNPVTNTIYVVNANNGSGTVSVIAGATGSVTATAAAGTNSKAITLNPVSNKVYVANAGSNTNPLSNNVTMIDAANSNQTSTLAAGVGMAPTAVAVNCLTNEIYVANNGSNDVTVIPEAPVPPSPLITVIMPLPQDTTTSSTPTIAMTATSATGSAVRKVYYQVDSLQGAWLAATPAAGGTYSVTTPPLALGVHTLYAFAADGSDATSINTGSQSSPLTGAIAAYSFTVAGLPPPVTYTVTPLNTAHGSISPSTQQVVNSGASVDFLVTPDNGYQIVSVTGSGCNVTILGTSTPTSPTTYRAGPVTANCDVTPTFSTNLLPVRIGTTYYQNLVDAYTLAPSGAVIIQAMATSFSGDLNLNRADIALTLEGGYDVTYTTRTGNTVMIGKLIIGAGNLVADRLTIQ